MATDSELRDRIRKMMCESDPDEVTVGSLYRKLEAAYGVDFSNKKAFVRREFAGFLMNYLQCDDDGDDSPAVNKRIKSESKEYDYKVGVVGEELAGVKGEEDVVKDQSKGKGTQNWRKRFVNSFLHRLIWTGPIFFPLTVSRILFCRSNNVYRKSSLRKLRSLIATVQSVFGRAELKTYMTSNN